MQEMTQETGVLPETVTTKEPGVPQETAQTLQTDIPGKAEEGKIQNAAQQDKEAVSGKTWQDLGKMLQKLGTDAETAKQIGNGTVPPKTVLSHIGELISGNSHLIREDFQDSLKELLGSKAFRNLLQSQMKNDWSLKPEDVAQKENVERLYERIREQSAKMNEAFQMVDKVQRQPGGDSGLFGSF